MATAWITYAWEDNKDRDVDFLAQELKQAGIEIKLDRWNIQAGIRLWDQIENFIMNSSESDAWILYATQNSLGSQACKEEYAYALDRALHTRGSDFPLIGIFPSSIDDSLIPSGLRIRLYVSLTDPDWKERIVSSVEGRQTNIQHSPIAPYIVKIHERPHVSRNFAIELTPRAGSWSPFFVAIPATEQHAVNPGILPGPRNSIPNGGMLLGSGKELSEDGVWWIMYAQNEATPTQSYFLLCDELPSSVVFGVYNQRPQYKVYIQKQ